jgi:hypothetical protein
MRIRIRIRIQGAILMRILADPNPLLHWLTLCWKLDLNFKKFKISWQNEYSQSQISYSVQSYRNKTPDEVHRWTQNNFFHIFGEDFLFISYFIQHCFICRPSDSTVPTYAGIESRTVATGALALTTKLDLIRKPRSHPRTYRIIVLNANVKKMLDLSTHRIRVLVL